MKGIFQTAEWEEFKLSTGYSNSFRVDDILVLQKDLPFGRCMLYSPMISASGFTQVDSESFVEALTQKAKACKAVFYRAEFDIPQDIFDQHSAKRRGFIKSFEEMQPEHTLLIDLTKDENDILAQMKPKGRYNIKVATRNNITVKEDAGIENFYSLYSTMAKRQNITFRAEQYFQNLFDLLSPLGYVKVFTAYARKEEAEQLSNRETELHNKPQADKHQPIAAPSGPTPDLVPIASAIVSFYGDRATYLFGGSSDQYRNLMGPYLVQWTAIREAMKRNCREYDFFGTAPEGDHNHPWAGVTRFKKQFGGKPFELAGSWDLVLRPGDYKLFKIAEKIRRR